MTLVVLGGSSGIGHGVLARHTQMGGSGINISRRPSNLQGVMDIPADLSQPAQVATAASAVLRRTTRIDGMVHCACFRQCVPIELLDWNTWAETFSVNVFGAFELTRRLAGRFHAGTSIVSLSSSAARNASVSSTAYAASQAALETGARVLAREWAERGIRVNVVAPGPTDTPGLVAAHERGQSPSPDELAAHHPRHRIATVDEQVDVVMYLLSDQSSFISGQVIGVNGGSI